VYKPEQLRLNLGSHHDHQLFRYSVFFKSLFFCNHALCCSNHHAHFSAAALPSLNARDKPVNVLTPVQEESFLPLYVKGAEPFVTEVTEKRSVILY
jgi:hypothetical protein